MFAYGVENYGTLQEYLVLDRYVDMIKPDPVIWQYCYNDFVNNDPEIEGSRGLPVDIRQRPYWVNGKVVQVTPQSLAGPVRRFAYRYSRFLVFALSRMGRLYERYVADDTESAIASLGERHPGFHRAASTTRELMAMVRSRVGAVPIVAFNCKAVEPYNTALRDISREHDILFLDEIAASIESAAQRGEDVFHADGAHWSEEGHRVVGEALAEHLKMLISEGKLLVPSAAAR